MAKYNRRNATVPGRLKPAKWVIFALADEAAELALTVEGEPWRKLALRSAVAVSQAKTKDKARMYLGRVHQYLEKSVRFRRK
jgi:hypothetical protein